MSEQSRVKTIPPTVRSLAAAGERIDRAALRTGSGVVYSLPQPARHHNVIADMSKLGITPGSIARCEQGFLSTGGTWLRRPPALRLAILAGQVEEGKTFNSRELFSEDVW